MIDRECALRIRELDITTLEGAYKHAVQLHAIHKAAKSKNVSSQQCFVVQEKATQRSDDQIIRDLQRRIAQFEDPAKFKMLIQRPKHLCTPALKE
jgi:hypothetical protein